MALLNNEQINILINRVNSALWKIRSAIRTNNHNYKRIAELNEELCRLNSEKLIFNWVLDAGNEAILGVFNNMEKIMDARTTGYRTSGSVIAEVAGITEILDKCNKEIKDEINQLNEQITLELKDYQDTEKHILKLIALITTKEDIIDIEDEISEFEALAEDIWDERNN